MIHCLVKLGLQCLCGEHWLSQGVNFCAQKSGGDSKTVISRKLDLVTPIGLVHGPGGIYVIAENWAVLLSTVTHLLTFIADICDLQNLLKAEK